MWWRMHCFVLTKMPFKRCRSRDAHTVWYLATSCRHASPPRLLWTDRPIVELYKLPMRGLACVSAGRCSANGELTWCVGTERLANIEPVVPNVSIVFLPPSRCVHRHQDVETATSHQRLRQSPAHRRSAVLCGTDSGRGHRFRPRRHILNNRLITVATYSFFQYSLAKHHVSKISVCCVLGVCRTCDLMFQNHDMSWKDPQHVWRVVFHSPT